MARLVGAAVKGGKKLVAHPTARKVYDEWTEGTIRYSSRAMDKGITGKPRYSHELVGGTAGTDWQKVGVFAKRTEDFKTGDTRYFGTYARSRSGRRKIKTVTKDVTLRPAKHRGQRRVTKRALDDGRQAVLVQSKWQPINATNAYGTLVALSVLGGAVEASTTESGRRAQKKTRAEFAKIGQKLQRDNTQPTMLAQRGIPKVHPSYYMRRRLGHIQRVKYSYPDRRNPFAPY